MTAAARDPLTIAREVLDLTHEDETVTVCSVPDNKAAALARAYAQRGTVTTLVVPKRPVPHELTPQQAQALAETGATCLAGDPETAAILLVAFTMFFVWSCSLALGADGMDAAREQNVPAYVIFHDATLAEMARRMPADLAELGEISGVGARKLEAYGAEILNVLGR